MAKAVQLQRSEGQESGFGLQLEFVSEPGFELAFEGLARGQQRIELLNLRYDGATQTHFATVSVPDGKLSAFEGLVTQYLNVNPYRRNDPRRTFGGERAYFQPRTIRLTFAATDATLLSACRGTP